MLIGGSEYGEAELVKFNKTAIQNLIQEEHSSSSQAQQHSPSANADADQQRNAVLTQQVSSRSNPTTRQSSSTPD